MVELVLKPESGTYALILASSTYELIHVGRLGQLQLLPGFYVYIGSACGPGGVRGRITHHKKAPKQPHWHVDYARPYMHIEEVWVAYDAISREHTWASVIQALHGSSVPLHGFGASDCGCESHFYFFKGRPSRTSFQRGLQALEREHPSLQASASFRVEILTGRQLL